MIKCPKCDQIISGIHYEAMDPGAFSSGSRSFVAVATPCNHAISAVPMTWEAKLDSNASKIEAIKSEVGTINNNLQILDQKLNQIIQLISR